MLQTSVADPHPVEDFEAAHPGHSRRRADPPQCGGTPAPREHRNGSERFASGGLFARLGWKSFPGSRPRDIDVVKFLIGAMESIADSSRAMVQRRQLSVVARGDFSPGNIEGLASRTGVLFEGRSATPSAAEDDALRSEEMSSDAERLVAWRDELVAAFDDDEQGQLLVMGMMDGLRGKELLEATDLTEAQFPTKYKKVQRRIEALQAARRRP